MGTKTRKNYSKGGSSKRRTVKSKVLRYNRNTSDIQIGYYFGFLDDRIERYNNLLDKVIQLKKQHLKSENNKNKKLRLERELKKKFIEKKIKGEKLKKELLDDKELGENIKFLMELFINDYLQLSKEYKRKHSMNKKYIYEEAIFFEIVIFLILSKYMLQYDKIRNKTLEIAEKIKKLREEELTYNQNTYVMEKTPEDEYDDLLKQLNKLREGETDGSITIKIMNILEPIQTTSDIDQYFSKLYKNYLLKGTNNHSLLLLHMKDKYDKTRHSLDKKTTSAYDFILELGPKMNERVLISINNLKQRTNNENNMNNVDITRYNSFKDFMKQRKKDIKRQQKNFEVHEKKLKAVIKILDPKNSSNNNDTNTPFMQQKLNNNNSNSEFSNTEEHTESNNNNYGYDNVNKETNLPPSRAPRKTKNNGNSPTSSKKYLTTARTRKRRLST